MHGEDSRLASVPSTGLTLRLTRFTTGLVTLILPLTFSGQLAGFLFQKATGVQAHDTVSPRLTTTTDTPARSSRSTNPTDGSYAFA